MSKAVGRAAAVKQSTPGTGHHPAPSIATELAMATGLTTLSHRVAYKIADKVAAQGASGIEGKLAEIAETLPGDWPRSVWSDQNLIEFVKPNEAQDRAATRLMRTLTACCRRNASGGPDLDMAVVTAACCACCRPLLIWSGAGRDLDKFEQALHGRQRKPV